MRAYGDPPVEQRFRGMVLKAIRQRIERHRHPEAVADALRVVPRSTAWEGGLEELEHVAVPDAGRRQPRRSRPRARPSRWRRHTRSGSRTPSWSSRSPAPPAGLARRPAVAGDHGLRSSGPGSPETSPALSPAIQRRRRCNRCGLMQNKCSVRAAS